jgi:Putative Actinobacterial Holin-X, holin superfamily III
MEHLVDGARPPVPRARSTGELVKSLSEQVSVLVHDELKLAQLEMTQKGKQAGVGAGMLGGGGVLASTAGVALSRAQSSRSAECFRRGLRPSSWARPCWPSPE